MSFKIQLLSIPKLFFFLIVIYVGWFRHAFFEVSGLFVVLVWGAFASILFYFYKKGVKTTLPFSREYLLWLFFFIYAFISGYFISPNISNITSSIIHDVEYFLIGYMTYLIISQDKKMDFVIGTIIICSLLAAVTTIIHPVEVPLDPGRYTMSLTNNANALGIAMFFGIYCIINKINFRSIRRSLLLFIGIGLMLYTLFLTGSRKSLFALAIIIFFWLVFSVRVIYTSSQKKEKRIILLTFGIVIAAVFIILVPVLQNSIIFARIQSLFQNGVAESRIDMYQISWKLFNKSPLFGIGYNQFAVLSGLGKYSHSTYAEAISCTGLVGTVLYFTPYIILFYKLIKKLVKSPKEQALYLAVGMFACMVFLATGVIHYYDINSNIIFGILIAYANNITSRELPINVVTE